MYVLHKDDRGAQLTRVEVRSFRIYEVKSEATSTRPLSICLTGNIDCCVGTDVQVSTTFPQGSEEAIVSLRVGHSTASTSVEGTEPNYLPTAVVTVGIAVDEDEFSHLDRSTSWAVTFEPGQTCTLMCSKIGGHET